MPSRAQRFHLTTLGCPKNSVDSDKMVASLRRDGLEPAESPEAADLVVVNTCAFVEAAREESVDSALALAERKAPEAKLVVTGCLAERYGGELADALPEADAVVGFAGESTLATDVLGVTPVAPPRRKPAGVADLLDLPRPAPERPWAYVKVAEGCDRRCAFCAIPTFRGRQASRAPEAIEEEARALVEGGASELVLVAQDIARYGADRGEPGALADLLGRLDALSPLGLRRQRLLYLYPSEVRGALLDAVLDTPSVAPYFDLSLQHASGPLLRRMRRFGDGERFLATIDAIRRREPEAVLRSSFIVGFPGETEADHEELLRFLGEARLDWAGFFPFSPEDDTPAAAMDGAPSDEVRRERIRELAEVQEPVTAARRHALVGRELEVLVDRVHRGDGDGGDGDGGDGDGGDGPVAVARSFREAPEIDGVVELRGEAAGVVRPGAWVRVRVTGVAGPDLEAEPVAAAGAV